MSKYLMYWFIGMAVAMFGASASPGEPSWAKLIAMLLLYAGGNLSGYGKCRLIHGDANDIA